MNSDTLKALALVAHRGYPAAFPENTLLGYQQAVNQGARYVETDIQCTRDGVPILYHDDSTQRLSGVAGAITGRTMAELGQVSAHHPERFGDRFAGTPIPTLKAFAGWLAQHPSVIAFVEVKEESLNRFGVDVVMAQVAGALEGVEQQSVIISFDDRCIEHTANRYEFHTGWVLPEWHPGFESRARRLSPDYLFGDAEFLPKHRADIWAGPWQWAVYVIDDLTEALSWVENGVVLVETDAIGDMLDLYRAGSPG
jgi:glycerophosphoryl diester phosphodiesterase